jgi:hypothetical protein
MLRQLLRDNFDGSSFSQVSGELGSVAMAALKNHKRFFGK